MGVGGGKRVPPTHVYTHMYTYTCMCTHVWHHREFPGIPPMGGPFAWNYHVYHTCICVHCVPACVCMCTCVGAPPNHPNPDPPTLPPPRATGSPNHQNSISLELIEIIRFCWTFFTSEHSWAHIDYNWSPQRSPTHLPHPQELMKHKSENYNNSWMNQDNSILFEDLGPLNPPAHI